MNWFKQSQNDWGKNPLFHFLNVFKHQVGNYEGIYFHPLSVNADLNEEAPHKQNIVIPIMTDYSINYTITLAIRADRFDVNITTDQYEQVGSPVYYFASSRPYDVVNDILDRINEHMNRNIT